MQIIAGEFHDFVCQSEMKTEKRIPFDFVLERLHRLRPVARPMFGCYGVYVGEKIVLVTRDKPGGTDNGVWVATRREHHASLLLEFPSMRSISVLGKEDTQWRLIPSDSNSFEEEVAGVCDRILQNDVRIGSVPGKKKKAAKPKPIRKR